jgi:ABC-type nitrate/sulfonate/bicarbonate transport system substrate-binding protein
MQERWTKSHTASKPLRVGFVPLCDCAPLVMAQELQLFEKYGLRVHLSREAGWATIRDKIIHRGLDAAHALAPMVFAASFGLGSIPAECVTGLVLGQGGNAITLTAAPWSEPLREGGRLRPSAHLESGPLVFGIPFLYSSHHFLLRTWLRSQGMLPERDVRFVVVPPPQMPANLKAGNLDGFCVGAPWSSVATLGRYGWCAAKSADIAPGHPEKVLMVRRDFAEDRAEEHERLVAALAVACRFCTAKENKERIVETLGQPQYINAPAQALQASFDDRLAEKGLSASANEPTAENAAWILDHLCESGLLPDTSAARRRQAIEMFRAEIFHAAFSLNFPSNHDETTRSLRQLTF